MGYEFLYSCQIPSPKRKWTQRGGQFPIVIRILGGLEGHLGKQKSLFVQWRHGRAVSGRCQWAWVDTLTKRRRETARARSGRGQQLERRERERQREEGRVETQAHSHSRHCLLASHHFRPRSRHGLPLPGDKLVIVVVIAAAFHACRCYFSPVSSPPALFVLTIAAFCPGPAVVIALRKPRAAGFYVHPVSSLGVSVLHIHDPGYGHYIRDIYQVITAVLCDCDTGT